MTTRAPERWQAFLNQIAERHKLVCDEASEGARAALVDGGFDPMPISVAWMAINNRLLDLSTRIIETWNSKVEATYEAEGYDRATQLAERRKGEDLAFALENARFSTEMHMMAWGARAIHARAIESQREHNCATCSAPLSLPMTYRTINVTCAHCRSVSTFEPGTYARNAITYGAHALSWEAAANEWYAMQVAERAVRDTRPPVPLQLLKNYERAQIAYWAKYFSMKVHFEPELHDIRREVVARMEPWYMHSAEHEETWRNAGRPRDAI